MEISGCIEERCIKGMVLANARLVLVVIDIPILMETSVPVLTVKLVRRSIIIFTIYLPL